PMNIVVALAVAVTKAVLIMLFFMHVKYSSKLTWVFVVGAFVWLAIMLVLVCMDFASRGMQTYGAPW
ncbi:MAG: cytochrome C oxidase subunit IV family protein, partial [Candidatus Hydrogenedentes bacterium]|nr:cytochrome C oxidase subunit IV family protein [Candidatus Hydrogenedentota bacterium]